MNKGSCNTTKIMLYSLLELSRYIVLNPMRAGIVKDPKDYRWSIYQATVGNTNIPGLFEHWDSIQKIPDESKCGNLMY